VSEMTEVNTSPDQIIDAASVLYSVIEDKDMRAAIASLAAMLIMPELEWPLLCDEAPVKVMEAAIRDRGNL